MNRALKQAHLPSVRLEAPLWSDAIRQSYARQKPDSSQQHAEGSFQRCQLPAAYWFPPWRCPQALALLLLAATMLGGCGGDGSAAKTEKKGPQEAALAVAVARVSTQQVQRTVEIVGTLHANEEIIISSQVEGRISSIAADLGDRVSQGQLLGRVQETEFRLAVEQAEGSLRETLAKLGLEQMPPPDLDVTKTSSVLKARAELDDAQVHLKRMKALYDEKVISAQEYDTAETRAKVALANYKNSLEEARALLATAHARQAQLGSARKKLRDTAISAPLTGSVSKRFISLGEYVKAGTQLFTIVQDHPLKLRGMIPERFAPEIVTGQMVELRVDALPNRVFKGKITRISPASEVISRSFLVECLVENLERVLKPGFFAKALVFTRTDPNALTVPQQALITFAGVTKVFVIENQSARERMVQTGVRVGANDVEITSGLKPAETVAVSGLTRLTDGARIAISEAPASREGRQ